MEWVGHLDGVGENQGEHTSVGTRQVEGGEAHLVSPRYPLFGQPAIGPAGRTLKEIAGHAGTTGLYGR